MKADGEVDILVIGPSSHDAFASNIAAGIRSLGHTVQVLDPRPQRTFTSVDSNSRIMSLARKAYSEVAQQSAIMQKLVNNRIERKLLIANPKLVISVWSLFHPLEVEYFRHCVPDTKWCFWYPDAVSNLGSHQVFLAPYDHFFFKEPHLVDQFTSLTSLPVSMLAEAANPDHHKSEIPNDITEAEKYECDVAIIGNMYNYRLLIMEAIPDNARVKIYGPLSKGFPPRFRRFENAHVGEYVAGRTKALAFGGAKIVLNTMHYAEIRGVNQRLFEATACGGFVVSQAGSGVGDYFEPGKEVVTFNSKTELTKIIRHYMNNDEERKSIALSGQFRAHRDHTYAKRVLKLFELAEFTYFSNKSKQ